MTKAAAQTAADDREANEPAEDRASAIFQFLDREVTLYEPTIAQQFVLVQTVGIGDDGADDEEKLELALGFAQMLRALFVNAEERRIVTGMLARAQAELEDYFNLAKEIADRWGVESEAPATNRTARRAAERRPAARPVTRRR